MPEGYGSSKRWVQAREAALVRARHRCEKCGRAVRLQVHHLDGRGMDSPMACDPRNLAVLCSPCHHAEHDSHLRRD
jgi:hypothetical protein